MKIGKVITELRTKKGLKQIELAKAIGVSASYLSLVEHDKQKPSVRVVANVAKYFDLPVTAILFKALQYNEIQNAEQKKYYKAAKPIVDKLINYLLS